MCIRDRPFIRHGRGAAIGIRLGTLEQPGVHRFQQGGLLPSTAQPVVRPVIPVEIAAAGKKHTILPGHGDIGLSLIHIFFLNGTPFSSVRDRDLAKFRRENLGFVFQEFNLLDTFSIRDNILLPLVLSQVPVKEMEARLQPVAKMLDITTLLDKFPYEVSGGEKQRAAVARAVITDPQILLADEPTGALDSRSSVELLQNFARLNREVGRTILMAVSYTHLDVYKRQNLGGCFYWYRLYNE